MANTMTKIATTTVGSNGVTSITFSNIPSTYTDLKLNVSCRLNVSQINLTITFNGSTTGYSEIFLFGNGASTGSGKATTNAYLIPQLGNDSTYTANAFNNGDIYIANYASSLNKVIEVNNVSETNATTAWQMLYSGLWASSAAITSMTLIPYPGGSTTFVSGSEFTLYGI